MPMTGGGNFRSRRSPLPTRAKFHIARQQDLHMTVAAAQRAAGPTLLALSAADTKGHQRRAVIQIDADPVPTHGLAVQVLAGPFVIEPSLAGYAIRAALTRDGARHTQMRQAVVIARGL